MTLKLSHLLPCQELWLKQAQMPLIEHIYGPWALAILARFGSVITLLWCDLTQRLKEYEDAMYATIAGWGTAPPTPNTAKRLVKRG